MSFVHNSTISAVFVHSLFSNVSKTLVDHNILSAPVFDEKTQKYTGFLDIRDLVSFVVFVDDDQKSDVPQNLNELIMHGCKLFKVELDGVTVTCKFASLPSPSKLNPTATLNLIHHRPF
jgi:hypothetical protein